MFLFQINAVLLNFVHQRIMMGDDFHKKY